MTGIQHTVGDNGRVFLWILSLALYQHYMCSFFNDSCEIIMNFLGIVGPVESLQWFSCDPGRLLSIVGPRICNAENLWAPPLRSGEIRPTLTPGVTSSEAHQHLFQECKSFIYRYQLCHEPDITARLPLKALITMKRNTKMLWKFLITGKMCKDLNQLSG